MQRHAGGVEPWKKGRRGAALLDVLHRSSGAGQTHAVQRTRERTAGKWCDDEHPEVRNGLAADEKCRCDGACRVHRDAGDIDADEVYARKREADGETREARGTARPGCAEDDSEEKEGCHHLEDQRGAEAVFAEIARAKAVLAQAVDRDIITGFTRGDQVGDTGTEQGARDLRYRIG